MASPERNAEKYVIAVVGNPNCGKTTLFNALTGSKQQVGNWPGVTVERKSGRFSFQGVNFELIDLPGTYSLDVCEEDVSLDEQIARDFVAEREADLIINIVDASNLERNLYLTCQLLEMKTPLLTALNMMDVAEERGHAVAHDKLANLLDCPVVPIVAASGAGLPQLKAAILDAARRKHISNTVITYPSPVAKALDTLTPMLAAHAEGKCDPRWLATRMLEGDASALKLGDATLCAKVEELQENVVQQLEDDIDICLADARYGFVNQVASASVKRNHEVQRSISDKIDRVVLNRMLGIPIFLFAMYLMFMFTINIGGAFIDFFDQFTGALFVDGFGALLTSLGAPQWLRLLLADGMGGGVQVVATFIPVIGFLYLFLSALEDSGYMARAAFVMDRAMRAIGLPGKAFVPLIVGFGCNVPAVMATRTMEKQRDRIMTIIMAPFMSCGARLSVYALFAAAFFPIGGQNVVFGLYIIGVAIAVLTGLVMKTTLLQGQATPFIMELPPYHIPTLKGVGIRTWERTRGFMFRAGKVIVPMVLALNVLNSVGTDGSYGNENSNKSLLSEIGGVIAPAFGPMGLREDNWPAAVGIFTGVLAKEAVVGTLDSLYSDLARIEAQAAGEEPEPAPEFNLLESVTASFATIPANLADALGSWSNPLGLDVESAAQEQAVDTSTFGAMAAKFDGAAGAFAYLLFILLYMPCAATIAAIYRETNLNWTLFISGWTTGVAYIVATVFYQVATLGRQPVHALSVIAIMLAIFAASLAALRYIGARQPSATVTAP
ncbi:Fe(2+) transporter permease subunit FeoB [Hahella sp. KA22]|uniref:Fe(2+) transporter permease subunit FeoB n=1 Tax=Hahella sp. KA22 TaxID=1628392 RepID=UPI000FDD2893|nr:Fe(2+) transporter permease subunit FeoB [Hahella sp. KA22]AZZ92112.1 Fe(2+) transporter permease subunit FeoB [Hahella sp. KA22]QAY55483.1 Fe(2+) transporter permease subunit FeoB [Hahella sp. KA22]